MQKRICFLDYTRIITAYLVVLGHLLPINGCFLKNFIYTFHISLFFLISGMLHKKTGTFMYKKYIKTILIPAFFFFIVIGILLGIMGYFSFLGLKYHALYGIDASNIFEAIALAFVYDVKRLLLGNIVTNGPCWFLFALFIVKLLMDFALTKRRCMVASLLICGILFLFSKIVVNPLSLGRAMLAYPLYLAGYFYKDSFIEFSKWKHSFIFSFVFLLGTIVCLFINGQPSYTQLSFGRLPLPLNILCFYTGALFGTLMVMSFCAKWPSTKYTEYMANCLITIVGAQALFYKPVVHSLGREQNIILYIIIAFVITVFCCILHFFLERYIPWAVGKKK